MADEHKTTRHRTTFRLRTDVYEAMKRAAEEQGRSVSNLTELLMIEFLKSQGESPSARPS